MSVRATLSRVFWSVGWKLIGPTVKRLFFTALLFRTSNFSRLHWLGTPILQNVLDLWTIQETIAELRPALIIETGTNRGGSSLFFAQLFDLMGTNSRIVTIDIERQHDLSHPRVTYLIGDSASTEILDRVAAMAADCGGPVLVTLDSDHSKAHVARELDAYCGFVTPGSWILVQDGNIDTQSFFRSSRPGPLPAIHDFLAKHREFAIDRERCERFLITHHPDGWLRRTRGESQRADS